MTARALSALGIWRLPLPIPHNGTFVNVYAIEEANGGLALVDTGVHAPESEAALAEGLARLGYGFSDVRRVLVSHTDLDHSGAARHIVERAGGDVPVLVHRGDAPRIRESGPRWVDLVPHVRAHLSAHGIPPTTLAGYEAWRLGHQRYGERVRATEPIAEGDTLRFKRFEARVLHVPGHTPGLVTLVDLEHRILFASDHLLQRGTTLTHWAPTADGDAPPRTLLTHLDSLRRTRALDVDVVLPGHGEPFREHRAVVDRNLQKLRVRDERIRQLLRGGARTIFELTEALYPHHVAASAKKTGLAMHQLAAHVEAMEEAGEVARRARRGVYRFELATAAAGRCPERDEAR